MTIAAASTGAASTASIEVATRPQTKIGTRFQVIPGARIVITVVITFMPTRTSEMPISANETR